MVSFEGLVADSEAQMDDMLQYHYESLNVHFREVGSHNLLGQVLIAFLVSQQSITLS